MIIPLDNHKLETVLFDALSGIINKNVSINNIIIPAGPAPFTQLRVLRAIQLGLCTGLGCEALMVNMFDILFSATEVLTGSCLLETRRGDYFFQTRQDGIITDDGLTKVGIPGFTDSNDREDKGETLPIIISDNPELSTIKVTENLAHAMLEKDLPLCSDLIYGITLPYAIQPKA